MKYLTEKKKRKIGIKIGQRGGGQRCNLPAKKIERKESLFYGMRRIHYAKGSLFKVGTCNESLSQDSRQTFQLKNFLT